MSNYCKCGGPNFDRPFKEKDAYIECFGYQTKLHVHCQVFANNTDRRRFVAACRNTACVLNGHRHSTQVWQEMARALEIWIEGAMDDLLTASVNIDGIYLPSPELSAEIDRAEEDSEALDRIIEDQERIARDWPPAHAAVALQTPR